jgi:uncharacterized protein with LGFP repeats
MSTPAIQSAYVQQGGLAGPLGSPTSDVLTISQNGGGTGQAFQSGSIYASPAGAYSVTEPIRGPYFGGGGASGALGWPTAPMSCSPDGVCLQNFQGGTVTWDPTSGATIEEEPSAALGG